MEPLRFAVSKDNTEPHPVNGDEIMSERSEHDVRQPPPRYKLAVLTWLAIYPALTLTLALLGPALAPMPLFLRTLIVTAVLVPIMVYVLVPATHRIFAGWLNSRG